MVSEQKTDTRVDEIVRRKSHRELQEMAANSSQYPVRSRDAIRKELTRRESRRSRSSVPLAAWIIPGWLLIQTLQRGESTTTALIVSLTIGTWVVWSLFRYPVHSPHEKLSTLASWFWLIGIVTGVFAILARFGIAPSDLQPSSVASVVLAGVILACGVVLTVFSKVPAAVFAAVVLGGAAWSYDTVRLFHDAAAARLIIPLPYYLMMFGHVVVMAFVISGFRAALTVTFDAGTPRGDPHTTQPSPSSSTSKWSPSIDVSVSRLVGAAQDGLSDEVGRLLDAGVPVDAQASGGAFCDDQVTDGHTALTTAALSGHSDVVELLTGRGADVNRRTHVDGITACMVAAFHGHADTVSALIRLGADVDVTTVDGITALMFACLGGHSDVAAVLLDHGANSAHKNQAGTTAAEVAKLQGHRALARLVRERSRESGKS